MMGRHGSQGSKLFDAGGDWSVVVVSKENDYQYIPRILPKRPWIDVSGLPANLDKLSSDHKKIRRQGPAFQIVTLAD